MFAFQVYIFQVRYAEMDHIHTDSQSEKIFHMELIMKFYYNAILVVKLWTVLHQWLSLK